MGLPKQDVHPFMKLPIGAKTAPIKMTPLIELIISYGYRCFKSGEMQGAAIQQKRLNRPSEVGPSFAAHNTLRKEAEVLLRRLSESYGDIDRKPLPEETES